MKKMKIILLITTALTVTNIKLYAQPYWNNAVGGTAYTVGTTTPGNVNIQGGVLSMAFASGSDPACTWRGIQGGTNNGGLGIAANTNATDGAAISLFGKSYDFHCDGEERRGSIYYFSNVNGVGSSGYPNNVGHRFLNWDNTLGYRTHFEIGRDGRAIIGPDVDYSFIAPGDNLTVRDQLGLFPSSTSAGNVQINGNTGVGSLALHAHTSGADGASVSLWGNAIGGKVQYIAAGGFASGATAHEFMTTNGLGTFHDNLIIGNDGHVVIGQDNLLSYSGPGDVLSVRDQLGIWPSWTAGGCTSIHGNATTAVFSLMGGSVGGVAPDGAYLQLAGTIGGGSATGGVSIVATGGVASGIGFYYANGSSSVQNMAIFNNGAVVIGNHLLSTYCGTTTNNMPPGYDLYVENGILTEKLKVANRCDGANWSDFVFNKNYDLMPLNEVESFVKTNKHLPEIPSASEVAKDGIDVAGMDAKLLQKIEELTLYAIEQQKELQDQKSEIELLKKRLK